jgi:hypothetical protein
MLQIPYRPTTSLHRGIEKFLSEECSRRSSRRSRYKDDLAFAIHMLKFDSKNTVGR